jgi:pimeloyl-ACP methyl ester carboxylesterase
MTPRSWEHWIPRYESRGYRVIAPAYPGLEIEVEALRADPSRIAALTVPRTVAHLEGVIRALDRPPIVMGHSFGGTLTQLLLDRGLGAAGVVIDSAPTEGVFVTPFSQIKSLFPILKNPSNRSKAVGFTPEEFHYAFCNTLSAEESRKVYDRLHIPAPGSWVLDSVLSNLTPGHQATWVDYANDDRAPLLFIAGGADHIMPASVNRSNAKHYAKSRALTELVEFPERSHFTGGEPGWEKVADLALEWAERHTEPMRRTA